VLDWSEPLRHATWYKAVYRPAVLRAKQLAPTAKTDAWAEVPLASPHLREPVRRRGNTGLRHQPLHGPFKADHDSQYLCAPVRG